MEGSKGLKVSKEQRLNSDSHHDQMISEKPSERAKRWFRRPAYSIRGDTGGQDNFIGIQEHERGNKGFKTQNR